MRFLVMISVLFASMMLSHTTRGAEKEDIEKVRLYLTSKYDGLEKRPAPEKWNRIHGPFLGETEAITQVKIPELEKFLPQTKFFVTRITTGQTCFLYAPIVVSVTPQNMDHDIRSSYSPMYTTPNGKFLELFTQLPTKSSKEKIQLVTGIGKLYAELMSQGEAKTAASINETAKIELRSNDKHWRTIKIQFNKKGISKSVLLERRFRIKNDETNKPKAVRTGKFIDYYQDEPNPYKSTVPEQSQRKSPKID
ncbi:MAG: hypothetical protein COA78_28965 [Blastopirellula sp.]|nr:MAG: hypothetical protein COA78_28965 [Blastopirellula sp.]